MSAEYYLMATESSVVRAVARTSKQPIQAAATQLSSLCGSWVAPPKLSCSLVTRDAGASCRYGRAERTKELEGIIPLVIPPYPDVGPPSRAYANAQLL